jgi:hypothetical protein
MGAPSHNRKSVGESRVKVESEGTSAVWHTSMDTMTGPPGILANAKANMQWATAASHGVGLQRATHMVKCILGIFFAPTCGCSALANAAASMVQWILKYGVYRMLHTVQRDSPNSSGRLRLTQAQGKQCANISDILQALEERY